MIKSYRDKETEKIARGEPSRRFPAEGVSISMNDRIAPIHPGEHLAEFLEEYGLTQYRLAKDIGVPPRRINQIVKGERAVTADTALRLARFFGMSAEFWMNLQARYDLERTAAELGPRLKREVKPLAA